MVVRGFRKPRRGDEKRKGLFVDPEKRGKPPHGRGGSGKKRNKGEVSPRRDENLFGNGGEKRSNRHNDDSQGSSKKRPFSCNRGEVGSKGRAASNGKPLIQSDKRKNPEKEKK